MALVARFADWETVYLSVCVVPLSAFGTHILAAICASNNQPAVSTPPLTFRYRSRTLLASSCQAGIALRCDAATGNAVSEAEHWVLHALSEPPSVSLDPVVARYYRFSQ